MKVRNTDDTRSETEQESTLSKENLDTLEDLDGTAIVNVDINENKKLTEKALEDSCAAIGHHQDEPINRPK